MLAPLAQSVVWTWPFIALLLCIALLPLLPITKHWWERNRNRLLVSLVLGAVTLAYYGLRETGFGHGAVVSAPGAAAVVAVIKQAVLFDYIPFITLLFSLYVISGGISLRGDLRATPLTNTLFLAVGTVLASLFGTTGAAMLLIRPVLQTNRERRHVKHTVIFFIFLVCNIGGCLLPLGDPPLFLGYLRGVPFLWTLKLWMYWLPVSGALLVIYYIWDGFMYRKEPLLAKVLDETQITPLQLHGKINFLWLVGVLIAVAVLVPGREVAGWTIPAYLREAVQLALVGASLLTTPRAVRNESGFNYGAIAEVAALFIGIFITMQVPLEILNHRGAELGLETPRQFFWATGGLSSFLDNAPTYVVFYATAETQPAAHGVVRIATGAGAAGVPEGLLIAISLGAVFMGAMTYIGNGPNFMVRSIAEQSGIKMPGFFGYMLWSCVILLPVFGVMVWVGL